jgi:hypothetical protein
MQNAFLMKVFQSKQHTSNEKLGLLLSKAFVLSQVVPEVTTLH